MKTWTHPALGRVAELPEKKKPLKTWNHLLRENEDWQALTGLAHSVVSKLAMKADCPSWQRCNRAVLSRRWPLACRQCLRDLHNDVWREVYGRELVATTDLGEQVRRPGRYTLASPRGCVIIVENGEVVTAYRPHPPGLSVPFSEADFCRAARDTLLTDTGACTMTEEEALRLETSSPAEVWHLALALGRAKANGTWSTEAVEAVHQRLSVMPARVQASLHPTPDLFDALESALDETDLTEIEPPINTVADWLVVTELIHGIDRARGVLERASDLVALAPEAWLALQPLITQRQATAPGIAGAWWAELDDLLGGLRLAALPVEQPATATLAQTIAVPGFWARVWSVLQPLGSRARQEQSGSLLIPAPAMDGTRAVPVEAAQALPPGTRVFVVDTDHPYGWELTDDWGPGEEVWGLSSPRDATWWVAVHGSVPGEGLAEVLDHAARDANATVTYGPLHEE